MNGYLILRDFIEYCYGGKKIELSEEDLALIREARVDFEKLIALDNEMIYGVHTGVGKLVKKKVSLKPKDQKEFQKRLIRSHACGTGQLISLEESRGVLLLLINMLRKGKSAASEELVLKLVEMFNEDKIPAIPEEGSLGASGDLIPLAHLALNLLGEGKFYWRGRLFSFDYTLKDCSIELKSGEALALINGTHFMTSILAHAVYRVQILTETADIIAAMTIRALGGRSDHFERELYELRPHPGAKKSAEILISLLRDESCSGDIRQDPYSLRCVPHVHVVPREDVESVRHKVEIEMNSITCNPIIHLGRIYHGGNFHGQILSASADRLSIAMAILANLSGARVSQLFLSDKLPEFLVRQSGKNTGLMMPQYNQAAQISENKTLAHPASVDSISVAGGQEDFVSMGGWAVRKAREICRKAGIALAVELLCAAQALDLNKKDLKLKPASKIAKIQELVRTRSSEIKIDRAFDKDIDVLFDFIYSGDFLRKAKKIMQV